MHFDGTITLGTILTVLAVLGSAWRINNTIVTELAEIKTKVNTLWARFMKEIEGH